MTYKTKQRERIARFFEENPDQAFSAEDIASVLNEEGVSLSAIYRNLAALEKERKVRKFTKAGSREAYYQMVDCDHCRGHIHMHCVECGKTSHLDDSSASALLQDVLTGSSFSVDAGATVLYGVCGDCAAHHHEGSK